MRIAKTWIQIEAVSAEGLCEPAYRLGDFTKGVIHGRESLLRPYVSITLNGETYSSHRRSEDIKHADRNGFVFFNRRIYFPHSSSASHSDGVHGRAAVYNLRNISSLFVGDPLIGEAAFEVATLNSEIGVTEQLLMLTRGDVHAVSGMQISKSCDCIDELRESEPTPAVLQSGISSGENITVLQSGISSGENIAVLQSGISSGENIDAALARASSETCSQKGMRRSASHPTRGSMESGNGRQFRIPSTYAEEADDDMTRSPSITSGSSSPSRISRKFSSLFRGRGTTSHGTLKLKLSLVHLEPSIEVLRNSRGYPLQTLARAIADVLRIPFFVTLLLEARPKQLVSGSDDEARSALRDIIEGLYSDAGVGSSDSDAKMLRLMSRLARNILEFSAEAMMQNRVTLCSVLELSLQWIKKFMLSIAQSIDEEASYDDGTSLEDDPEDRLQRFLAAAQICIEQLEPIDGMGYILDVWATLVEKNGLADAIAEVPKAAQLGIGTFGKVWRARDRHTGKHYAVKNMLVKNVGYGAVAEREAQVANHICGEPHPCVVQIFHVGCFESEESDLFFLVMEMCPGGDLSKIIYGIRKSIKIAGVGDYAPPGLWKPWIGQIFLGLEHLHRKLDVLLRDLKPENVILNESNNAKLTDFGFSHMGIESAGGFGTFGVPPGTPHYISPEIVLGRQYAGAADIFSFGVLIWVLMTGGVKTCSFPMPPCLDYKTNYCNLSGNSELLAKCIADPASNHANPVLDDDAKDFILSLTQIDPDARPTLDGIRQHRLLAPLQLPPFGCECNEIELWLQSCMECR